MGFLTGKITPATTFHPSDLRARFPRFTSEAIGANRPIIDLLADVARQKGATPAQIALAWLLVRKPWIVPIPGATKLEHLEANMGALDVALSPEDAQRLETAFSKLTVHGARAPDDIAQMSDDMS
jgi:aryl-alcohol dehydrogenase-like predicted oxidoreductase